MPIKPETWRVSDIDDRIVEPAQDGSPYETVIAEIHGDASERPAIAAFVAMACSTHGELVEAARRLEVAANTAAYCYAHRPENFASALHYLRDDAEALRTVLSKVSL